MADHTKELVSPTLSDALAALVTSVSMARVQADLSSAQVAQFYRRHDILRAMPVPRIRLNRVHVSVPLVVTAVRRGVPPVLGEAGAIAHAIVERLGAALQNLKDLNGEAWYVLTDPDARIVTAGSREYDLVWGVNQALYLTRKAFEKSLAIVDGSEPPCKFERYLKIGVDGVMQCARAQGNGEGVIDELAVPGMMNEAVRRVLLLEIVKRRNLCVTGTENEPAEHFFSTIIGEREPERLPPGSEGKYVGNLYQRLLAAMPALFELLGTFAGVRAFKIATAPPEVEIAVHTADVKNQGNPGTITRLNMILSEEGMEWVAESGTNGEQQWKLLPE